MEKVCLAVWASVASEMKQVNSMVILFIVLLEKLLHEAGLGPGGFELGFVRFRGQRLLG